MLHMKICQFVYYFLEYVLDNWTIQDKILNTFKLHKARKPIEPSTVELDFDYLPVNFEFCKDSSMHPLVPAFMIWR